MSEEEKGYIFGGAFWGYIDGYPAYDDDGDGNWDRVGPIPAAYPDPEPDNPYDVENGGGGNEPWDGGDSSGGGGSGGSVSDLSQWGDQEAGEYLDNLPALIEGTNLTEEQQDLLIAGLKQWPGAALDIARMMINGHYKFTVNANPLEGSFKISTEEHVIRVPQSFIDRLNSGYSQTIMKDEFGTSVLHEYKHYLQELAVPWDSVWPTIQSPEQYWQYKTSLEAGALAEEYIRGETRGQNWYVNSPFESSYASTAEASAAWQQYQTDHNRAAFEKALNDIISTKEWFKNDSYDEYYRNFQPQSGGGDGGGGTGGGGGETDAPYQQMQ